MSGCDITPLSTQRMDGAGAAKEETCGEVAKKQQVFRLGKRDLSLDEGAADIHLGLRRRAVARRPPGHDIAEHDGAALKPDGRQHAVEQKPGLAGEGKALAVVIRVRHRADDHDGGGGITFGENRIARAVLEVAAAETLKCGFQLGKRSRAFRRKTRRRHGLLVGHGDILLKSGRGWRATRRGAARCRLPLRCVGTAIRRPFSLACRCHRILCRRGSGRAGGGEFSETVDRGLFQHPVHARIRMEMQEGGEFGRGEVVSGDHGRKLPHVPRPGNP
ncbi:hypothetical protein D3C86_1266050 [compost metagenome]